jgi:hemolysin III
VGHILPLPRPRLRGVSHHVACFVALAVGAVLVLAAEGGRTRVITAVYVVTLAGMFGVSATLHRSDWGPRAFAWLRRADHAMIFAFIAGTYTPLCVLGLANESGMRLLALAWTAAGLGILRAALWPHAPRVITSGLFVAVGWVVVAYLPEAYAGFEPATFWLLVIGGIWFTLGALIYLLRWPDPWPEVFGFHEVFHVLIIIGCACHFVAVARVVL